MKVSGLTIGFSAVAGLFFSASLMAAEPAFLNAAQLAVIKQQLANQQAAPQTTAAYQQYSKRPTTHSASLISA